MATRSKYGMRLEMRGNDLASSLTFRTFCIVIQ
jgi:hypothetical protein